MTITEIAAKSQESVKQTIPMKKYTRKIDELGRFVLPAALRKKLNITPSDEITVHVDFRGRIILKKKTKK